eukprot:TRINITY_DN1608_c0_g4_i19.p1 TRINITY_DN1608_c0_g4~~TRINITY_DN1608_c0_g4_i19.p1  ORF type:complete len:291 (+),score=66.58 TRINITY_DN1608_c0_g4_i19:182-1054(+)
MAHFGILLLLCFASPGLSQTSPRAPMPLVNLGGVDKFDPSNFSSWLALGGRGIDTALVYGDQTQAKVAAAIRASRVPRDEIFLTTKVPCCPMKQVGAMCEGEFNGTTAQNIAKDVAILGAPIDMLLLHWPCDQFEDTLKAYAGMEEALAQGLVRAIGVSNFDSALLKEFLPKVKVKPAVNQCGHSIGSHNATRPFGGDDDTATFCAENGIVYSAYSPLGGLSHIDVMHNPAVVATAKTHNVSTAQVALRWLVQQKIAVVTAANNPEYQKEDMDLFSFSLSDDEMRTLAAI